MAKLKLKIPKKLRGNLWRITTIFLALVVLFLLSQKCPTTGMAVLSAKSVAEHTVDFINNYLLQGQKAKLLDYGEKNGMYWIKIRIGGNVYESYISKDGKLLFPSAINMEERSRLGGEERERVTCEDLPKAEKPVLRAFVVSYCPFGLQMMRILDEIIEEIPELREYIEVRYIGDIVEGNITSMHGPKEAMENLRQICIREEQEEKFWDYLACFMKKGETEKCLDEAGVDRSELRACMKDSERGIKYASEDFEMNRRFGISGSPTLVLNDEIVSEFDFGGRTAEAVKTIICCGFSDVPDFCSKELSTQEAARGFSETYAASSSSSPGRC